MRRSDKSFFSRAFTAINESESAATFPTELNEHASKIFTNEKAPKSSLNEDAPKVSHLSPTAQLSSLVGDDVFFIPAVPEIVNAIPRVKVPRHAGCSMFNWSDCLQRRQKELGLHKSSSSSSSQASSSLLSSPPSLLLSMMAAGKLPQISPEEVRRHCTPDDLWVVVRGVVYDCTKFQHFHPGGEKILQQCAGRDCTALFDHFHAWVSCEGMMAPFAVATLPTHAKN